ncbi:PREDICTED: UPF0725 protein At3g44770-like [Camelina sativa]|uniref:UPF0725 protein At3g44770-like n=1 Tax=Camelina sativa TaxID=90675 RepID=A0ABM0VZM9_CAMSA|nr:PREDICTED: UPF0725 protein At3g44770-like [Camelina sativa]
MADTLRRMLDSGKLTDEQCLSMLRVLDSDDKVVGRCTCQKVIEEKAFKRIDNRKPLKQLLEMRNLSDEEYDNHLREIDEDQGESEEVDERYFRQMIESQLFDIDPDVRVPRLIGLSHFYFGDKEEEQPPPEMDLYGQLAVHWFNFENNRNLKFLRIPKLNTEHPFPLYYYITVEVKDEVEDVDVDAAADSSPSSLTLQTMVTRPFGASASLEAMMEVTIEGCRIKPTTTGAYQPYQPDFHHFMFSRVDALRRGCMPTFLSGPPEEAADDQRFYEVPDEDIRKNDWLRLYAHFALFKVCEAGSHAFPPKEMELKKVLVQTRVTTTQYDDDDDDDEPPSPIFNPIDAKSKNAIFHISFEANCRDYTSVVRRTVDGVSGHMQLEVNTTETDCFSSSTDDQS